MGAPRRPAGDGGGCDETLANDVADLSAALRRLGFDVTVTRDAGRSVPSSANVPDAVTRALKSLSHLAQATVLSFDRRSFRRVDISNLEPRKRA